MSEIVGKQALAYPSPVADNGQMVLLYVLCKRVEGTFKAYAAIVPDDSLNDPTYSKVVGWVQRYGSPVRHADACKLFDIRDKDYAA